MPLKENRSMDRKEGDRQIKVKDYGGILMEELGPTNRHASVGGRSLRLTALKKLGSNLFVSSSTNGELRAEHASFNHGFDGRECGAAVVGGRGKLPVHGRPVMPCKNSIVGRPHALGGAAPLHDSGVRRRVGMGRVLTRFRVSLAK
ncbi:hypothetical protein Salat_2574000 [Sesamum alatum]|uniref:Uncharacterized protein n=1 Tax=Sesamum alatum TaxID=300844 RepID=A0AAE2CCU6_9LAMI|nr:hypothetical protein Salat_2574000 [Sesamum alatum]